MGTNVTWMNNATDPGQVVEGVINSTNGSFIITLMISVAFIVIITLKARNKDMDEIFIYTGALEFIIATFAIANQYIDFYWIMLPVALLFTGIMVRLFAQD